MPQSLATLVYGCLILALFLSARERESRVSSALWIPVAWVSIGASRTLAQWFYVGPTMVTPDEYLEGSALDRFILTGFVVSSVMVLIARGRRVGKVLGANGPIILDRKSTRLNSSHITISYAVFCLKKKKKKLKNK